jgi:hypothetical protein
VVKRASAEVNQHGFRYDAGPQIRCRIFRVTARLTHPLIGREARYHRLHKKVVAVQGMSLGEVVSLTRGPVGSTVTLELRSIQKESSFKVALIREAVPIEGQNLSYQKFVGQQAPALEFSTLNESSKVKLSQYRGKVIVVDFWATWCGTCYKPVQDLQQLARSHPEWNKRGRKILPVPRRNACWPMRCSAVKRSWGSNSKQIAVLQRSMRSGKVN